jgi:autotransporter-associated beta strand protein
MNKFRFWFGLAGVVIAVFVMLGSAEETIAQRPLGIDVSSYEGSADNPPTNVNWTSVKSSGVTGGWAKAAEGDATDGWIGQDPDFTYNVTHAKSAGVILGYYYYCHPETDPGTAGADAEANFFWQVTKTYMKADGLTLMPMLDFEQNVTGSGYTASTLSAWGNRWCQDIVNLGASNGVTIKPVIYTFISYANGTGGYGPGFDSTITQWPLDMANVDFTDPQTGAPAQTYPWSNWNFWQYNWHGVVPGIEGDCDEDVFNGTSAQLIQSYVVSTTNATIYYWDPQGTNGGNPYTNSMTGSWEGNLWTSNSAGQASLVKWPEGGCVCFGVNTGLGTPAFTVTANSNHTFAGMFDGPLNPNSCNVTVNGTGILTLAAGPQGFNMLTSIDGSTASMTISNMIAGTGQVVPENYGQLSLNGANTYTGGTQLGWPTAPFSGTVYFNNNSSFGTGKITLSSLGTGAALAVEGTSAITIANAVTVTNATTNTIIGNPAGVTFSGAWTLTNGLTLGSGGATNNLVTISGAISGSAYLAKTGPGILALSGANTYTGGMSISAGTLSITGSSKLNNGAYAGNITNNGNFAYASSSAQTLSGIISGSGSLTQSGPGQLTLTSVNSYSGGTTVNNGVLEIGGDRSLGAIPNSLATNVTLNSGCLKNDLIWSVLSPARIIVLGPRGGYFDAGGGTTNPIFIQSVISGSGPLKINMDGSMVILENSGNNYTGDTIVGASGPGYNSGGTQAWLQLGESGVIPGGSGFGSLYVFHNFKGLVDIVGTTQTINGLYGDGVVDNSAGNGVLRIGANGQLGSFSGVMQNSGGTLSLTKIGTGELDLSGANTYTGPTSVNSGSLILAGGSIGASTVTVASNATLGSAVTNTSSIGGMTTFNSGALGSFTAVGGSPSVVGKISVTGDLNLNGNALTISVSGPALATGTYRLLDCSGTLSGAASATPTIAGTPLAAGYTATVNTTVGAAGHVDLVIAQPTQLAITGSHFDSVGGNLIFSWQSSPGATYHIIGSTNPSTPLNTWTNVFGPITATDTNTSVTNPVNSSAGFFDVVSP